MKKNEVIWIVNGKCMACGALVREPGAVCKCLAPGTVGDKQ